jgi:hypothetical protein
MKQNMGTIDRIARLIAAIAIVVLYFTNAIEGTPAILLLVLAGLLALTSLVGFCPLYAVFGVNTSLWKEKETHKI